MTRLATLGNAETKTFRIEADETVVWLVSGGATVSLDGDVISTLAEGDPQVLDGLPAGHEILVTATSATTVVKVSP